MKITSLRTNLHIFIIEETLHQILIPPPSKDMSTEMKRWL